MKGMWTVLVLGSSRGRSLLRLSFSSSSHVLRRLRGTLSFARPLPRNLVMRTNWKNEDFQDCIRRTVPNGYQFKGYPTCFGHTNVNEMWRALIKSTATVSLDLLSTKGIDVALALRVKGQ